MASPIRIPSQWRALIALVAVVVLASLVQSLGVGDVADRRIQDTFIRVSATVPPPHPAEFPDVAVITIDPRSLRALPAWPWPRSLHATAIENLEAAGAQAIAFDIDFSAASSPSEDMRFAKAIQASKKVALATFSQTQSLGAGAELEIVNRPIPLFEESSAGLGSVLVPIDSDGVVRNAPRSSEIGGNAIPSLARAALAIAAGGELQSKVETALRSSDETLVDFRRGFPAIPTVPYVDLIENRFDPELLRDRVVFIGATAAEFQDLWATPIQPALPGVMIQAIGYRTAAAEAADLPVLHAARLPWIMLVYAVLALVTFPHARQNGFARGGLSAGAMLSVLALGWLSLWKLGIAFPVVVALGLIGTQYVLGIESLKQRIQRRATAQEMSLDALAQIGSVQQGHSDEATQPGHSPQGGLELALKLLGDVVGARGVVLRKSISAEEVNDDEIEWRPNQDSNEPLPVDLDTAQQCLAEKRVIKQLDPTHADTTIVYSPLFAGVEHVGVLIVFCAPGRPVDSLHSRTIATVGAQLALTAQNLRLIDRLRETFESSIAAVAGAVEARDGYTDQHCRRLAAFSSLMGTRLGMSENEIRAMELGALLHDVGKIGIPDAILNKPGRLSDEERQKMQEHPEIGAGIVAPVLGLEPTTLHCVVHHHERWDGTGYPEGLSAEEIPLPARIVSIVDVWDALSTRRPYKKAFTQPEVRDLIQKGRGSQFDPMLVDLFFEVLEEQGEEMLELIRRSSSQEIPE